MTKISRYILSISFVSLLLLFFFYYLINNLRAFRIIENISASNIIILILLNLTIAIINGASMNITIASHKVNLSFNEYTSISVLSSFGNIFLPFQGGIGLRAVYFKSRYNLNYTLFISSLAGNYIIIFNVISIFGLIVMYVLYLRGIYNTTISIIYIVMLIGSIYFIFCYPIKFYFIPFSGIKNRIQIIIDGWLVIKKSVRNIIYLYILTCLNFSISIFIMYTEFKMLQITDTEGLPITFLQSTFIYLITTLSLFINLTPASLGIREGLVILTSNIVNISPSYALAVTILDRIINFSLLLVLAYPASRFLKNNQRKQQEKGIL
ncbi:lysylphosphatidylglycerol synthase transmembrane domain-containing protein [Desulforhabdus sp. TSK]|uniref:lysylphosphatidylglycerol synthase transmembrane domain-containing protein n=1 Tax=Desulforhabdus sp. TSK TaxID=2925014 RepID=UPI001FC872FF|nr:lysylphosphatidylglycerol synthase transmembrane domain-containing protein [Desulforhabdus sp. TSK]GKT08224.1 hypothetical protein DSTSK_15290 [Desulforhabdus sp. TSK]